jgi:hypothetical protein
VQGLDFPAALANGVHGSNSAGLKGIDREHLLRVSEARCHNFERNQIAELHMRVEHRAITAMHAKNKSRWQSVKHASN